MSDEEDVNLEVNSKKRASHGRMRDVSKKIKLQSHETGL